jgi:D-tyrosyl-tRNA(Tyr) deacylase
MRVVIQRVSRGAVRLHGRTVGEIGKGLVVLLGIASGDTREAASYLAGKVAELRIFPDKDARMNLTVSETRGAVLVVSQFTLFGDVRRGRRPSFVAAARPEVAEPLYEAFVEALLARELHVETGMFRATMEVELVNDGPVTILVDSDRTF